MVLFLSRSMFQPFVRSILLCATACAFGSATSVAWGYALSQGETPHTVLCVDTGHARITRLCAQVVLRYKIDALLDVPLYSYGITWKPTSWTVALPDGSSKPLTPDHLPAPVTQALANVTLQLRGTALADFSDNPTPLFLQYQTQAVTAQNKTAWTGSSRTPMDRWLFTPGQCPDGPHRTLDPLKAMALYKDGVKAVSIDPRSNATLCKTGTQVGSLDEAGKAMDRYCEAESGRQNSSSSVFMAAACLPPTAAGMPSKASPNVATLARWSALLDDGVPAVMGRPTMALLDTPPLPAQSQTHTASRSHPQPH